jgi:TolB-like protein
MIPLSARRRIALLGAVLIVSTGLPAQDKPIVAVLYFDNGALVRPADYAPLSKGMADMMITELSGNTKLRVVERDRLQTIIDELKLSETDRVDRSTAVRIGRLLNARHLLTGGYVIDPKEKQMRLDVRAIDVETSEIEFGETLSGDPGNVFGLINDLAKRVSLRVEKLPASSTTPAGSGAAPATRPASPATPPRNVSTAATATTASAAIPKAGPDKFRAVMLLSRALIAQDKGKRDDAIAFYRQAIDVYPNYTRAKVLLAQLESRSED